MNEYYSCNVIESGFDAQINSINLCCRVGNNKFANKIILINNFDGKNIDLQQLLSLKKQIKDLHKAGNIVPQCDGCIYLQKKHWENENNTINTININNWIKCNASCIYCDRKNFKGYKEYKIYPLIKQLIEQGYLRNPADITIAGGEPTITSDFDKTLKILMKYNIKTVRVLTNAIKYNKYIQEGIEKELVNILVSTDSGTPETYKRIKLVNQHNQVWKNLKKYASYQKIDNLVQTKYIIMPGINSAKKELDAFIQQNAKANIKRAYLDIEIGFFLRNSHNKGLMDKIYEFYLYGKETGEKYGVAVEAFDRMKLIENF